MALIYKILPRAIWETSQRNGVFTGAGIDVADGYIHLSTAAQVRETAAKYFAGQTHLLLVAFDAEDFATTLKWEVSRGGALFPHIYGTIETRLSRDVWELPWNGSAHEFPGGLA